MKKNNPIPLRGYETIDKKHEHYGAVKQFVNEKLNDTERPILKFKQDGCIIAQDFAGVVPINKNVVLEILPKIPLLSPNNDNDENDELAVFYKMLRRYKGKEMPDFSSTAINKIKNFDMLEAFKLIFLQQTLDLVKRGIASQYHTNIDNLPYLKGRLQFPQQTVKNATNAACFYTAYDVYSPNRPANRLIHKALLSLACTQADNQKLCRQLLHWFVDIPPSTHIEKDWSTHSLDKNMQHYKDVMRWVELLLFHQGLTTFRGQYQNKSLLFPMEKLFEDYVSYWLRQTVHSHHVRLQNPKKKMLRDKMTGRGFSTMKPDIALINKATKGEEKADYILDCKWKPMFNEKNDKEKGADLYQLFTYGKMYQCKKVMLLYPKNKDFTEARFRTYNEDTADNPLKLISFPFDLADPKTSAEQIRGHLIS